MSAGHTPGPWDCTGCSFPDDDMGGVYYRVHTLEGGMVASGANARLIAAAPEMLEALEALTLFHESGGLEGDADSALAMSNAAIAKAKGGAA